MPDIHAMQLLRHSILKVSAIIFFLAAVIFFFLNPFGYEEFELLFLPAVLVVAAVIVIACDIIIRKLTDKGGKGSYLFAQILTLEIVVGAIFFLLF